MKIRRSKNQSLTVKMDEYVRDADRYYCLTEKEKQGQYDELEALFAKEDEKGKSVAFHYALYLAKNARVPDPFITVSTEKSK